MNTEHGNTPPPRPQEREIIWVSDIREQDWYHLRDRLLPESGWQLRKGGGIDHSWGELHKGSLTLKMEYDIWSNGDLKFARSDQEAILAALPEGFVKTYSEQIRKAINLANGA